MVLEFDRHCKRASPDLSIYIYSSIFLHLHIYIYIHIHIHAYISRLHGISCSDPHLEHHSFPDLFVYIYHLSTYIHAYISCLHGISCSDPHLEHHCFEHSSLSLSLKYLPIKWIVKQQNPKFGKIILFWLMVLEFDKHHKRASPDLSIYIY